MPITPLPKTHGRELGSFLKMLFKYLRRHESEAFVVSAQQGEPLPN